MPQPKSSQVEKTYVPDNSRLAAAIRGLAFSYVTWDDGLKKVVSSRYSDVLDDVFKVSKNPKKMDAFRESLPRSEKNIINVPDEVKLPDGRYVKLKNFRGEFKENYDFKIWKGSYFAPCYAITNAFKVDVENETEYTGALIAAQVPMGKKDADLTYRTKERTPQEFFDLCKKIKVRMNTVEDFIRLYNEFTK